MHNQECGPGVFFLLRLKYKEKGPCNLFVVSNLIYFILEVIKTGVLYVTVLGWGKQTLCMVEAFHV